jgi:hypothetical protein
MAGNTLRNKMKAIASGLIEQAKRDWANETGVYHENSH